MPRAGPRPYECVRRAWHSERHEAMRGSIIQQIFRVVSEAHSPATKKNREWKEKLPVVVLKAEEIMYSKANSEAEYLNLETLWERVNDAVDTIIRRDDSNETGNLLPPCVEAALNLGCVPVRASRSQRHSNPRNYLTPREQELPALTPTRPTSGPSPHLFNQSHHARLEKQNLGVLLPDSCSHGREAHKFAASCSSSGHLYDKSHHRSNQLRTTENDTLRNLGSVYPLYYGNQYRYPAENSSPLGLGITELASFDTILVGMPVGPSNIEPGKVGIFQSRLSHDSSEHTRNYHEYSPGTKCDPSLRLGRSSDPCVAVEGSSVHEDVGSVSLHEVNGLTESRVQLYRDICSFPCGSYYHQQQFK